MRASDFSSLRRTCATALLLAGGMAGLAAGDTIELVSRVDPGALASTGSGSGPNLLSPPSISQDGRYVAFLSVANNLVPGQIDLNANGGQESDDVFLYDRIARTSTLVSHAADSPARTGDGESRNPVLSADGRWVAFTSQATNLASGLAGVPAQVRLFLYDRISAAVTLVSSSAAIESSGCSGCGVISVAISADGRFVAFNSTAPDLVPGQPDDGSLSVFLYDRITGETERVSRTGIPATTAIDFSLSADGHFVAFDSFPIGSPDLGTGSVYLYDHASGTVTRVGPGSHPTISADGGSVAFLSAATQVIPGQADANGPGIDVFLYSRTARTTVLVSHAAGRATTTANAGSDPRFGSEPLIFLLVSADGRFVAFLSSATNLVPRQNKPSGSALFLYDRASGTVILASRSANSPVKPSLYPEAGGMSANGRFLTFASGGIDLVPGQIDFNSTRDVFLFDRKSGKTVLVSSRSGAPRSTGGGFSHAPAISADGSQIAFYSFAPNLVAGVRDANGTDDLFLYDVAQRTNAVATLHPPGMASVSPDADSVLRGLSADGRWVLFEGAAANLVPGQVDGNGQSDVFLYDHTARKALLVSRASASPSTAGDGPSFESALSADGRFVVFASLATNLDPTVSDYFDPATTQRRFDVFLFDRVTGKTLALSRSARHPGVTGDFDSVKPVISADGRWVAFISSATDLVPASSTATGSVYLYDRVAGVLTRTNAGATTIGAANPLALSADGRYLLTLTRVAGHNIFLYDRVTGTSTLVSHDPSGAPAGVSQDETPALSADGRFVAFTGGPNLGSVPGSDFNVYLWDREGGGVTFLGGSTRTGRGFAPRQPAVNADGRFVVFLSNAETPAPGFDNPGLTNQIVLYDRIAGTSTLVTSSALAPGQASQGNAAGPTISPDGRYVAYSSYATDLVASGPTVLSQSIYLYDRIAGTTIAVTPSPPFPDFYAGGFSPRLSADGRSIAFESTGPNLVPRDFNGVRTDVFLLTRTP